MFILISIPFGDLRPLIKGEQGRVAAPDWTSVEPQSGFVRGFGKLAARNSRSYGLLGERFFADFNNAVRLRGALDVASKGWPRPLNAELRFRRLYFDGRLAGRLEFGFLVKDDDEDALASKVGQLVVDPREIAADALALPIGVITADGREQATSIQGCARPLGVSYLSATTRQTELAAFPPGETYGGAVQLGPALVFVRLSNDVQPDVGRDRAEAKGSAGQMFFTSSAGTQVRNNVVVRLSKAGAHEEAGEERAVRVLFSHLNALMFAHSHFLAVEKTLDLGGRAPLKEAVDDMISRLQHFTETAPADDNDAEFSAAMKVWGKAFEGRADELVAKLSDLSQNAAKPGPVQVGLQWLNSVFQLVVKTGVESMVEQGMKQGG
jgi:hypothetical protein